MEEDAAQRAVQWETPDPVMVAKNAALDRAYAKIAALEAEVYELAGLLEDYSGGVYRRVRRN